MTIYGPDNDTLTDGEHVPSRQEFHCVEAEQALLGAMMVNNSAWYRVSEIIGPEHFFEPLHARIFETIGDMMSKGQIASPVTVIPYLRNDETLIASGGPTYIARLAANAITVVNAPFYAETIKDVWLRRQSTNLAASMLDDLRLGGDGNSAAETISETLARLVPLREATGTERPATMAKVADAVLTKLSAAYEKGTPDKDYAAAGSVDLAKAIGGWRRGRFYVIAGRPGMGKSTVAMSFLLRTALKGNGVMFFSLEMSRDELTEMALCDLSWRGSRRIEYRDIQASRVMENGFVAKYEAVSEVRPLIESAPFLIADKPGLTINQIRAQAAQYAQRLSAQGQRLDVICIDHLNLIAPSDSYRGNKSAETEEISMSLKRLAKELDIAVISLVQLNRAVEGREDKRPGLSDLRWSGAIEQDADVVMFVYREAYYLERKKHDDMTEEDARKEELSRKRNNLEVIIAKHRGGPCPVLEFYCDMGCAVVRDKEHTHA